MSTYIGRPDLVGPAQDRLFRDGGLGPFTQTWNVADRETLTLPLWHPIASIRVAETLQQDPRALAKQTFAAPERAQIEAEVLAAIGRAGLTDLPGLVASLPRDAPTGLRRTRSEGHQRSASGHRASPPGRGRVGPALVAS